MVKMGVMVKMVKWKRRNMLDKSQYTIELQNWWEKAMGKKRGKDTRSPNGNEKRKLCQDM